MGSVITITESEVLEALRNAMQTPGREYPDAFTSYELCKATGKGTDAVRRQIRTLIEAGQLEAVQITITNVVGQPSKVWAYRVKR